MTLTHKISRAILIFALACPSQAGPLEVLHSRLARILIGVSSGTYWYRPAYKQLELSEWVQDPFLVRHFGKDFTQQDAQIELEKLEDKLEFQGYLTTQEYNLLNLLRSYFLRHGKQATFQSDAKTVPSFSLPPILTAPTDSAAGSGTVEQTGPVFLALPEALKKLLARSLHSLEVARRDLLDIFDPQKYPQAHETGERPSIEAITAFSTFVLNEIIESAGENTKAIQTDGALDNHYYLGSSLRSEPEEIFSSITQLDISGSSVWLALLYLNSFLKARPDFVLTWHNARNVFGLALIEAIKINELNYWDNKKLRLLLGLEEQEVNFIEIQFIRDMQFNFWADVRNARSILEALLAMAGAEEAVPVRLDFFWGSRSRSHDIAVQTQKDTTEQASIRRLNRFTASFNSEGSAAIQFTNLVPLGHGSYGSVFLATRQHKPRKQSALKRMEDPPKNSSSFITEISCLRLSHPHLVGLEDVLLGNDGKSTLVLEYCAGGTVQRRLQSRAAVTPREIRDWMRQLLLGLDHLHERGIIHADIKTTNLLLTDTWQLKIADFGSARLDCRAVVQHACEVVTRDYRSLELLLGLSDYGSEIDIWSAGCVFAELALGTPPFNARTHSEVVEKILALLGPPTEEQFPTMQRTHLWAKKRETYRVIRERAMANPSTETLQSLKELLGPNGFDLLIRMLAYEPGRRISAKEALGHPYFL